MQFLVVFRRRSEAFTDVQFAEYLPAEAERARELYAEGIFRQVWTRGDVPGACILMEVESEAAARAALATLPLFERDMLELVSLVPLKPYRGFIPQR